ncbi:MAG: TonB-dependent receptor [Ignavibacteriales bacterium]|nr:TonB-dependent receptor [Ignavibacteriales bacterium]
MHSAVKSIFSIIILLGLFELNFSQDKDISISGFIYDATTGEALIGTNILVYKDTINLNTDPIYGAAANNFGFYMLPKLKRAKYYLIFRYIGYKVTVKEINLTSSKNDLNFNVQLNSENIKLSEIVVEGKKIDKNVLSTIDISPDLMLKLPSFSGEMDLFRSLMLLPGINKGSELSNGLYVRGGSPDQTLTLVDGAVLYNPAHIGNIASTFNSNAIRDIKLIKGAFPAEYGGRLSSVLDIKLKSGTKEKETGTIGLGVINSFFSMEGPLKDAATYMVAGRWMYYDALQRNFNKQSSIPLYNFYDLNGKINFNISDVSAFSLSAMYSSDRMYNPKEDDITYDIEWKNLNVTLNWLQINSKSLFLNSSLSYVNYEFSSKVGIGSATTSSSSYFTNPNLTDLIFKQTAELNWAMNQKFKTGFEMSFHNYDLLYNEYYDLSYEKDPFAGKNINSIEAALYFQNESEFFDRLNTNIGGRIFYFDARRVLSFEPRISFSYQMFDDFYIKTAAALANQYLHLISRNDIALPTDLWYPATANIEPSRSAQFVFGLDTYFYENSYQASIETYYRDMKKLYEFKNSPEINPLNNSIEDQFLKGEGEAYGIEIFFQKRDGNLQGWVGYTLSWTKRKFDELNAGKIFYPKYDRRHDLSLAATYNLNDAITFGATFTYATGMRYNAPDGQFIFNPVGISGPEQVLLDYDALNTYKFPAYHKLDLSFNYKIKMAKVDINLFANFYNVYNRRNAFAQFIVFPKDDSGNDKPMLKRISLFPFIPALGVSITF